MKLLFIFISLFIMTSQSIAADIRVQLDRTQIQMDESFRLIYTARDDVDGKPDFKPLEKDFEILGNNKSSQTQIINGSISSQQQWILTLIAKRKGKLEIPRIRFGKDQSQATYITVGGSAITTDPQALSQDQDIFLEVALDPEQAYVQQQLVFRLRLYRSVATSDASLSEPEINGIDAVVQKLGEDKQYRKTINGRLYEVFERDYAVFPQQSGRMVINPVLFKARLGRGGFFIDPFSADSQLIVRRSEEITIDIQPIPASYQAKTWLPAYNVDLQEKWSEQQPQFEVGKAITRTLQIQADGLTASQIPEIAMNLPADIKAYPEAPQLKDDFTNNGISGIRQQSVALIPSTAGSYILPEIRIPYWSIEENTMVEAVLPERKIQVLPSKQSQDQKSVRNENSSKVTSVNDVPSLQQNPIDTTYEPDPENWPWQLSTLFFAVAWLITLIQLIRKNRHKIAKREVIEKQESTKQVLKRIHTACQKNEASLCVKAIVDWGRVVWPNEKINTLHDIELKLGDELKAEFSQINQSLYASNSVQWQGQAFWQSFKPVSEQYPVKLTKTESGLPPLFKLVS